MNWIQSTNAKEIGTLYLINDATQPWQNSFQDSAATFIGFGLGFYLKFFFVLFLLFSHLYLFIFHNKEEVDKVKFLQSGIGGKDPKKWLSIISGVLGTLGGIIAIKNEIKDQQIGNIQTETRNLMKVFAEKTEELETVQEDIVEQRRELIRLQGEKVKHTAHWLRLTEFNENLSKDIDRIKGFNNQASSDETAASDLIRQCEILKKNITRYGEEVKSENGVEANSSKDKTENSDKPDSDSIDGSEINKSSIMNFDFDFSIEWYEGLGGIQKLAVGIILCKSTILSALTSIVFIFYGDILLEKYDIANKYPKLAKIIELRKKYQKYYFKYNCLLIFIVVMWEFVVGLSILAITSF